MVVVIAAFGRVYETPETTTTSIILGPPRFSRPGRGHYQIPFFFFGISCDIFGILHHFPGIFEAFLVMSASL